MVRFRAFLVICLTLTTAACAHRDWGPPRLTFAIPAEFVAASNARAAPAASAMLPPWTPHATAPRGAAPKATAALAGEASIDRRARPASGDTASSGPANHESFVCAGDETIELDYSDDRSRVMAILGDGAPVPLFSSDRDGLLTYQGPDATLQRSGPRLAWITATGSSTAQVKPGDTLSKIVLERLGSLRDLDLVIQMNAETIPNPDLIYPGQTIALPAERIVSCRLLASARAP